MLFSSFSGCYVVLIIVVLDALLLTFLKFKISQLGSPGKQIFRRSTNPERELVFDWKKLL